MPTSSQNQVLSKVTGKKQRRTLKEMRKLNLEAKQYELEEPLEDFDAIRKESGVENTHKTSDEQQNEEEVQRRLHDLGFWDKKTFKEKVGLKVEEGKPNISPQQYSKVIIDEVMAEVKKVSARKDPPQSIPSALCFDLKGSIADHSDVLDEMKKATSLTRGQCQVKTVQFLPVPKRWLINMDSRESRDRLAGTMLFVNGYRAQLRRYDDIMTLEYRKYLRANGLIEMINNVY